MDLLGFTEEELIAFRNGGELVKPLVNEVTNQEIAKNGYFLKEHEMEAENYPWTRVWRGDIEVASGKICECLWVVYVIPIFETSAEVIHVTKSN